MATLRMILQSGVKKSTILVFAAISMLLIGCSSAGNDCDLAGAEICVNHFGVKVDALSQLVTTNPDKMATSDVGTLCIQSVVGSNFTECYMNATSHCKRVPRPTELNWDSSQNEVFKLCETVCPGFIERTTNISRCNYKITHYPNITADFGLFCDAINKSLQCAIEYSVGCVFYQELITHLLPKEVENLAATVCRKECKDVDVLLQRLAGCQQYMNAVIDKMDCSSLDKFKNCLKESGVPGCPLVESVVNATYPDHIYSPLEKMCNGTDVPFPTPDSACQKMMPHGYSQVEQCLQTVISTAEQLDGMEQTKIGDTDCLQYRLAEDCIENSGVSKCVLLAAFQQQIESKHQDYFDMVRSKCDIGKGTSGGTSLQQHSLLYSTWFMFTLTMEIFFGTIP